MGHAPPLSSNRGTCDRDRPRAHRKVLWRAVGSPGALHADGEIIGTWRARKAGSKLQVDVTGFRALSAAVREEVDSEAQQLAGTRGAKSAEVAFDSI